MFDRMLARGMPFERMHAITPSRVPSALARITWAVGATLRRHDCSSTIVSWSCSQFKRRGSNRTNP